MSNLIGTLQSIIKSNPDTVALAGIFFFLLVAAIILLEIYKLRGENDE